MTPEERAKAIIETFLRETTPETTSGTEDCWRIEKHIASALRQTHNDAIESAARTADDTRVPFPEGRENAQIHNSACKAAASRIRALTHKEP